MTAAVMEAPPEVTEDQAPAVDPDAPYGRKPDGTPYKRTPVPGVGERLAAARAAKRGQAPPPPRKATAAKGRTPAVDYRPGVLGLLQVPAFTLSMAGRLNPVFHLDAAAITLHAPTLAEAVHQTAVQDPRVAAILDKVLQIGPYGALLGALVPLAMQLAANHGVKQAEAFPGVLTVEQLVAAVGGEPRAAA